MKERISEFWAEEMEKDNVGERLIKTKSNDISV